MFKRSALLVALVTTFPAFADTTSNIKFEAGTGYYGTPNPPVYVQGNIVRGQWVHIEYPNERMESFVLSKVYGSYHCYGYGPGCEPVVENVQKFYRFNSYSPFSLAQGDYIEIPKDAQKLEMYFFAPKTTTKLYFRGDTEVRDSGEQYDSQGGSNYQFNF